MHASQIHRSPLNLVRILSLDIVAGVLAVSYFFVQINKVQLPIAYWVSLGLTVWFIYLADHLADSYLPGMYSNKTELQALHEYRKLLSRNIITAIILLIPIVFFLPWKIILFGIAGAVLVIIYLVINQIQNHLNKYLLPRELVISLFYIFGTAGVPFYYANSLTSSASLSLIAFFLLILSNTMIFAYAEYPEDKKHGIRSLAVTVKPQLTRILGILFAVCACLLFSYLAFYTESSQFGIIGLLIGSVLLLLILFLAKSPLSITCILADAILILPLVLTLF